MAVVSDYRALLSGSYWNGIEQVGNGTLDGGDGDDTLVGGDGNDNLDGEGGDDTLTGGLGRDLLSGGSGADRFVYTHAAESAPGEDRDVISDWESIDRIDLTAFDANSTLAGVQNFVFRGAGFPDRTIGQGQIKFYHVNGNTYVVAGVDADNQADFQIALTGLHFLTADHFLGLGRAVVNGAGGNDTIPGTPGPDTLNGLGGNDTLDGRAGDDALAGGLGKDLLSGGDGADRFVFASTTETPVGDGRDIISDWDSTDRIDLTAFDAHSTLAGLQTFTFLGAGFPDRTIGQGQLKYYQVNGNTYIAGGIDADNQADFQIELTGLTTFNVENFIGLGRAILTGTSAADTMMGTDGDDTLSGLGGNDTLVGGDGSDTLIGGVGKDLMIGGAGIDRFVFGSAAETPVGEGRDVLSFSLADKIDLTSFDANSTMAGMQKFIFMGIGSADRTIGQGQIKYYQTNGNTYIVGGVDGDNQADFQIELTGRRILDPASFLGLGSVVLTGGDGVNTLEGSGGNDVLNGLGGDDFLLGRAGNDVLDGGAAADTLTGGLGKDTLRGGTGRDRFVFDSVQESTGDDRDVIADWEGQDRISLLSFDADSSLGNRQGFIFIGAGTPDRSIGQGLLKYYHANGNTYLVGGVDADDQADFEVELTGLVTLTTGSFQGLGGRFGCARRSGQDHRDWFECRHGGIGLHCHLSPESLALWYVVGSFALVLLLSPFFRGPKGGQGRGAPVQPVLVEA